MGTFVTKSAHDYVKENKIIKVSDQNNSSGRVSLIRARDRVHASSMSLTGLFTVRPLRV